VPRDCTVVSPYPNHPEEAIVRRSRFVLSALAALVTLAPLAAIQKPASAEVTEFGWPYPPNFIEGFAAETPPVCDPTDKPGPVRLAQFLDFWFDGFRGEIHRDACGSTSYHKEGRALDWMIPNSNPDAQAIIDFMLARVDGERHARARRWGLEQIIWIPPGRTGNHIWKSYDLNPPGEDPWSPCNCTGDHSTHIHFSFSPAGAMKHTTWHTVLDRTHVATADERQNCGGFAVTVKFWVYSGPRHTWKHVRFIQGPNRKYDTQAELENSSWRVFTANGNQLLPANTPVRADFVAEVRNGDCRVRLRDNA